MEIHIINQIDSNDETLNWVAVDNETAKDLYELEIPLYYVRDFAESRIDDKEDLEIAMSNNAVCVEDSYLWNEEFEEEAQNRFRNNDHRNFEEWVKDKINSILE